jgi:hypothetical protein
LLRCGSFPSRANCGHSDNHSIASLVRHKMRMEPRSQAISSDGVAAHHCARLAIAL